MAPLPLQFLVVLLAGSLWRPQQEMLEYLQEAPLPDPVSCPETWIGVRLAPRRIEHWQGSRDRIHTRTLCWLDQGAWQETLLQP